MADSSSDRVRRKRIKDKWSEAGYNLQPGPRIEPIGRAVSEDEQVAIAAWSEAVWRRQAEMTSRPKDVGKALKLLKVRLGLE